MSLHAKPRTSLIVTLAFAAAFVLGGCGLRLSEDITPPPNYRSPTPPATQPAEVSTVFPLVAPNPAQGEAIYAQKCLPCHGATGMGDGPQSGNLPNPPPPIGSAELASQSRPADWFNIVTRGNLERLMPGFSQSLNDGQRWDVVAYVLSLSASANEIEQGKALYGENCAACHGENGLGDGAQAASLATKPTSWKEQSQLSQLSANDISNVIAQGAGEMPAYADTLDESQRLAVAAYIRTLSFASSTDVIAQADGETQTTVSPAGTPGAEGTPVAALQKVSISGKVINSSSSGALPVGMKITLLAYKGMDPAFELAGDIDAQGNYTFVDVDYQPDYVYIARVDVNQMSYNSDILHGTDITSGEASLPVTIYDISSDSSVLKVDRLHIFFDFSVPGSVQVVELFIISNPTDKVIAATAPNTPVINFDLPAGAQNLQFENGAIGDRYVQTSTGFGDTQSVEPGQGQHQVLFAYELPYDRKLDLTFKSPLPVDAAILMLPQGGVRLKSNQLTDAGERSVQGMSFKTYQATAALAAGDTITVNLSGTADGTSSDSGSLTPVLIGAGVFLIALGAAAFWFIRQRQSMQPAFADASDAGPVEAEQSSDDLLDAILALDDQFQSGQLPEAAYHERRSVLKARLAQIMGQEKK